MNLSRRTQVILLVAVLVVAAAVRAVNYPMFAGTGDQIAYPSDGDTAYHLYRTREAVEHFPHVPVFDRYVNWPHGAPCQWSTGYDVLAAAWVLALGGRDSPRGYVLTMLFPIVCGLALVAASALLARRVTRPPARAPVSLTAALLVALSPAAVLASCYGRTDHHGLEAVAAVLLACWAITAASGVESQRAVAGWGSVIVAFALWVFSGSPLYVAITALSLGLATLLERSPRVGWGAPAALAAGGFVAAVSYLPAWSVHRQLLTYVFPSLLQPGLCVVAGALLALALVAARRSPGRAARLGWFLVGALALASCVVAIPGVLGQLRAGIAGWILHRDPWLATISEFQPLFAPRPALQQGPLRAAVMVFGSSAVAALGLAPLAAARIRRVSNTAALVFSTHAFSLLALTVVQVRFARVAAPFAAVVVAVFLYEAVSWAARESGRPALAVGAAAAAMVGLLVVDPSVRGLFDVPRAELDPVQETAIALRPAAEVRPGERGGVLAAWSIGNFMRVVGRRPVVVTGFGIYLGERGFWDVARVFSRDERSLLELMDERDLGYLVASPLVFGTTMRESGVRPFVGGELGQQFFEQFPLAPLLIAGSGVPESGVRHLEHFLPVYATRKLISGLSFELPLIWSYERVAGARLVGSGPPRARVEARLAFRAWDRPYVWRAWTDADASGHWDLRVPVPSGYTRSVIRSDSAWTIRAGGAPPVSISISEAAVRRGDTVEVQKPANLEPRR